MANPQLGPISEVYFSAAAGLMPGFSRLSFVGTNLDIDTLTTPETLWEFPAGGLYPWPTVASLMEVLSDNAADTAAGTGARTVRITGLTDTYAIQTEVLTLNGLTPVPTLNSYLRINRFICLTAGSGGQNAGNLTCRVRPGGNTLAYILATQGFSHTGVFTVPDGFTLFVVGSFFSMGKAGATDTGRVSIRTRFGGAGNAWADVIQFNCVLTGTSNVQLVSWIPYPVVARSDIELRCVECTTNNVTMTGLSQGLLVENTRINFYPAPLPYVQSYPMSM